MKLRLGVRKARTERQIIFKWRERERNVLLQHILSTVIWRQTYG